MVPADRHRLTNLSLGRKLLTSAALLLGLGLFFGGWIASVELTRWDTSATALFQWGERLEILQLRRPQIFWVLFIGHVASLALVGLVSGVLLRRVALARGARKALMGGLVILGALDLACWLLLPFWEDADALLGGFIVLEAVLLLYVALHPLRDMWIFRRWKGTGGPPIRVAIVGGGFAGLYAALHLDRRLGYHRDLQISVIDRRNYFLFPPLLPSVAAGSIETRQVTYPFRRIFEAANVAFKKENVDRIDLDTKTIRARVDVDDDPVTGEAQVIWCETQYDILVLAPGSDTNTFNTPGVKEHAFFMRELGDAIAVRNHIIDNFERAARETDADRRREQLTFVVVGAGPTGVELAAEVRDLIDHILMSRYPEIDPAEVTVYIIQAGEQILPGWHKTVVGSASDRLRKLKVELRLNRRVVNVTPFAVTLDDGTKIATRTCVWCAGVKPSPLLSACNLPLHRSGRVEIGDDLRVKGRDDVFVLGDAAFLLHDGAPLPPLGQVAFQQGQHAAKNIDLLIRKQPTRPFKYFNFGALVSVGDKFAAIDLFGVRMSGFIAWWVWRTLYLAKLVGFGNKVRVVLDWTLDLIVERSISQIAADRQDFSGNKFADNTPLAARPRPQEPAPDGMSAPAPQDVPKQHAPAPQHAPTA
ncbi:NAD(P)/FAD-dependent oxidoreductase [Nannocystis radixulma]|uniref:NADH:ubiquinone reductase (non-electrogenic) n=1 Tax=Nannocystis radixulma TaxID=2995305 RepID=A0ABT5BN81_9BACT|nr:NAD(P)/FAD-dependent oxidoreductase [Nannocystis radixulma]MDC0675552.1 NAD(P)/FAD-dependent oxidoreductase [Nannocystis radixulma]